MIFSPSGNPIELSYESIICSPGKAEGKNISEPPENYAQSTHNIYAWRGDGGNVVVPLVTNIITAFVQYA